MVFCCGTIRVVGSNTTATNCSTASAAGTVGRGRVDFFSQPVGERNIVFTSAAGAAARPVLSSSQSIDMCLLVNFHFFADFSRGCQSEPDRTTLYVAAKIIVRTFVVISDPHAMITIASTLNLLLVFILFPDRSFPCFVHATTTTSFCTTMKSGGRARVTFSFSPADRKHISKRMVTNTTVGNN